jgi:hypothetical protein
MPVYKTARHGVQLSEALHEAAVVASVRYIIFVTFELWHSSFDEPIYVVDNYEDLIAKKESTATRDASTYVTFMKSAIRHSKPEESDTAATPEITLEVDNVSGPISRALRTARGSLNPWELTMRLYASNDLTAPDQSPPTKLLVTGIEVSEETATLTASYGDPANFKVPKLTFKRSEYPGLVR